MTFDFRASADKTILKALHPWSTTLTKEEKDRLRAILKRKGSKVWERNKNRLRTEREHRDRNIDKCDS